MGTPYSYPTGPDNCEGVSSCPLIDGPTHGGLVFLYCFWSVSVICFVSFFCLRPSPTGGPTAFNKIRRRAKGHQALSTAEDGEDWSAEMTPVRRPGEDQDEEEQVAGTGMGTGDCRADEDFVEPAQPLLQRPLRRHWFGDLCLWLWSGLSAGFLCMFLVLIVDYYYDCQLGGVDAMCFYGSHPVFGDYDTNSEYFITTWFLALAWFGLNLVCKDRIGVWFMHPCAMMDADHVHVWVGNAKTATDGGGAGEKIHFLVRWIRAARRWYTAQHLQDGRECVVAVERAEDGKSYFIFEATRYLYNPLSRLFQRPLSRTSGQPYAAFHAAGTQGLSADEVRFRACRFGLNRIPFTRRSVGRLFRDEVMTCFYLYQMMMYLVWFWFSYLFVAAVEFSVVLTGAVVSTYLQWSGERTIATLADYETAVVVRRGGREITVSSHLLVPGDVVLVTRTDWVVPCDMILTAGECIMDESGLTGESMPVQKKACPDDHAAVFDPAAARTVQHMLYAGTTVLQTNPGGAGGGGAVQAYVTAIGSTTSKGELVSAILFPEELRFRYEEELEAVICLLLIYGAVAFALVVYFITENGSQSTWITKWVYGVFTASQIFSPLLPVALKVGQIRSSQRLQEKDIFCVSPRHIAICGKINVFCFDKTGTLTKEGMDFSGAVPVTRDKDIDKGRPFLADLLAEFPNPPPAANPKPSSVMNSSDPSSEPTVSPLYSVTGLNVIPPAIVHCMATCHNVAIYGENKFVGNEVEVKMFSATGWTLQPAEGEGGAPSVISPDGLTTFKILKRFEFDHGKQCMSVVVECAQSGKRYIITKGSFEKMATLCCPDTVPGDFVAQGKENAMQGGYVLGIARRELQGQGDWATLSRDEVEAPHTLELQGLLIFRNEPKLESREAIMQLRKGHVRPVMITGDNAQCGQYICRSCELIDPEAHILLGELDRTSEEVSWSFMGGEGAAFSSSSHHLASSQRNTGRSVPSFQGNITTKTTEDVVRSAEARHMRASDGYIIELAVTGNDTLRRLEESGQLSPLLTHIRMFSRMSPENKTFIIHKFRNAGYTVGMCGDGGNDCGALRAAHAGIALSEAEASVVSPFTSHSKSPLSVVDLLKEGRASLATSFANYKFLISYGLQFSVVKLCSFFYGVLMSCMSYYFIDGVALTTLCYTMTLSRPLNKLSQKRPSASLLGASAVLSTLGVNAIVLVCLVCALRMMENDPDYVRWPSEYSAGGNWWNISDNWEATVLYAVMYLFLLSSALIYSFGYQFRESVCENVVLLVNIGSLFVLTTFLILMDSNRMTDYWHMASYQFNSENSISPVWRQYQADGGSPSPAMSIGFRFKLYFLVAAFIVLAVFFQAEVMEGSIAELIRRRYGLGEGGRLRY